jgi:hypothetical protein
MDSMDIEDYAWQRKEEQRLLKYFNTSTNINDLIRSNCILVKDYNLPFGGGYFYSAKINYMLYSQIPDKVKRIYKEDQKGIILKTPFGDLEIFEAKSYIPSSWKNGWIKEI